MSIAVLPVKHSDSEYSDGKVNFVTINWSVPAELKLQRHYKNHSTGHYFILSKRLINLYRGSTSYLQ